MQVLSHLLSFPATHPALPAALQQKALLTMLSAFSSSSAFSALPVSTSPEQALSTFPSEPEPEEHTHIEQAVVPALEAMAALGHEGPLESTAVPVLYATAQLGGSRGGTSTPMPSQLSSQEKNDGSSATDNQQAVRSPTGKTQWRRDVALHALARIACTSTHLRQPILARLTEAIPGALAGAVLPSPHMLLKPHSVSSGLRDTIMYYKLLGVVLSG